MSIKFSIALTGILFAAVFTISQKAPAQATETGNTGTVSNEHSDNFSSPPTPHRPHLIKELLYQVAEVNRKLQAGVVVQCHCSNDYWWPIYKASDSVSASDRDWWSDFPNYKKIVKGYGYNLKSAKFDALKACGPGPIPAEPLPPPDTSDEGGPKGGSKITIEDGSTAGVDDIDDSITEEAFIWCHHSKRFLQL